MFCLLFLKSKEEKGDHTDKINVNKYLHPSHQLLADKRGVVDKTFNYKIYVFLLVFAVKVCFGKR